MASIHMLHAIERRRDGWNACGSAAIMTAAADLDLSKRSGCSGTRAPPTICSATAPPG
jgi:hypothetical protein